MQRCELSLPNARRMMLRSLQQQGQLLDRALVLPPAPRGPGQQAPRRQHQPTSRPPRLGVLASNQQLKRQ